MGLGLLILGMGTAFGTAATGWAATMFPKETKDLWLEKLQVFGTCVAPFIAERY